MPSAEIITIGTELLLGETSDTNTRFIARTLRGLGIDIYRTQMIGDNTERIAAAIGEAVKRSEVVITTGGIGPTVDDPTRQAVAQAAGTELEFRPDLWEQVEERVRSYGRPPSENQKRQAYLPKGSIPIRNPVGTAPAFILEKGERVIISLPGVPREMETLLSEAVIPYLQKHFDLHEVIRVRTLHTAGVGEGMIDEKIGDLEALANPTVGLTAHSGIVSIRIAAKAGSQAEADRQIASVEDDLRQRLGNDLFGVEDETLAGAALAAVSSRSWNLVSAEIGTGGALAEKLTRTRHSAFVHGRQVAAPESDSLCEVAESLQEEQNAAVALGLSVTPQIGQSIVEICLHLPTGNLERHLTYGGHPGNAIRWGVNMALDWLRRTAQGDG